MTTRPRALIWIAVSTIAQASEDKYSFEVQETDSIALCNANDWDIVDILRVPGHSRNYKSLDKLAADARAKGIPAFDKLIEYLEACDFDILVCRDANRFARRASLMHYIIESIVEDCGAKIYSLNDGMVDSTNADMFSMIKGYETSKQRKWLIEGGDKGKDKLAAQGLPIGPYVPLSHIRHRDPITGRTISVSVNENLRRLWDDLATVFLEGVAWNRLGTALYERFGHVDHAGLPYSPNSLYYIVLNPIFHGHSARCPHGRGTRGYIGRWIFDTTYPAPDGVKVWRDTCPPVYTGQLAEQIRAELHRRMDIKGRSRPSNTYRYSRLAVCGECGRILSTMVHHQTRRGLHCRRSELSDRTGKRCSQRKGAYVEYLNEYINALLVARLEGRTPDLFPRSENTRHAPDQVDAVGREVAAVEAQITTLINEQSLAPMSAQPLYRTRISALAEQLDILKNRMLEVKREAAVVQQQTEAESHTVDEIRALTLDGFWKLSDREINQVLRRLFGTRRLVIMDGKIVDILDIHDTRRV